MILFLCVILFKDQKLHKLVITWIWYGRRCNVWVWIGVMIWRKDELSQSQFTRNKSPYWLSQHPAGLAKLDNSSNTQHLFSLIALSYSPFLAKCKTGARSACSAASWGAQTEGPDESKWPCVKDFKLRLHVLYLGSRISLNQRAGSTSEQNMCCTIRYQMTSHGSPCSHRGGHILPGSEPSSDFSRSFIGRTSCFVPDTHMLVGKKGEKFFLKKCFHLEMLGI